jgi:excisionase family DNA binding protein
MAADPDGYLTPKEVAVTLATSRTQVHRWIKSGDLPAFKNGHLVRISRTAFDQFLAKHQA